MKHIINGFIYKDNTSIPLKFEVQGSNLKIQGKGTGNYKIKGKLGTTGESKYLALINATTLEVVDTAIDDNIYIADVCGLSQIEATDISGISEIYADITID